MQLWLMRHGIAIDRDDPACPPEEKRFLTPVGIKRTREVAQGLNAIEKKFDVLLSSPYLRAMQTAEILAEVFGVDKRQIKKTEALLPEADPSQLFKVIENFGTERVICFGHAPNVDEVIRFALQAPTHLSTLKKAGVACLELRSLSPVAAELSALYTPKVLRLLA